jgi:uncharacterized membrane protein
MHTRVKPLLIILVVLLLNVTMALAQEETPPVTEQAEQTAALTEANTSTPSPAEPTEEAAAEATLETIEATAEPVAGDDAADTGEGAAVESEVRGLPLGVLLIGAVAVLLIGTIVLVRENPRPLEDEE